MRATLPALQPRRNNVRPANARQSRVSIPRNQGYTARMLRLRTLPRHRAHFVPGVAWCLPLLMLLAACGGRAPTDSEAVRTALAKGSEPSAWEPLDAGTPPRRLRDPRTGITFVRVPAGEFVFGPAANPQTVRISKDFLLAEDELTIAQWQRCVAELGADATVPVPPGNAQHPMPMSWLDAESFCARLGYRLPTEAEWERACRADHTPANAPWSTPALQQEHSWYNANAGDGSHPCHTRKPNAWGFHDMLGNLWEWCADHHANLPKAKDVVVDPTGPTASNARVLRGGSWFTTPGPLADTRTAGFPVERNLFYGLRPARSL